MTPKIIIVLLAFLLSILITACSTNLNNSSSTSSNKISTTSVSTSAPSDNKIENVETQISSEKSHTITVEKILNILSTKNKDVIDSLSLSDSDIIKSINGERFYVPVFYCEELGILIGFNGAPFDSADKVKEKDETPIFIMPTNGTIISFDKNINFRVGDDTKQFKDKFGEGTAGKEGNLKGDKQYCFLTYDISNLNIRFTSLVGDDFKKYDVYITELQFGPSNNTASSQAVSKNEQYLAMEAYKSVLQNKVDFISTDEKENKYLNDFLNGWFNGYDMKVTHFTVLDMDGDKTPEVVLELTVVGKEWPDLYEVLHYMNGTVYGYNFTYRGLEMLKSDGTFWSSGGASDNRCGKMRFTSNGYEEDILGYSESSYNNDGITISYFINNKPVAAESFDSFCKEQDKKKDAVWYEFSQKNVETELSINS